MKKLMAALLVLIPLSGCSTRPTEMDRGLALRTKLLNAAECSFDAEITADYEDRVFTFAMHCTADNHGMISFEIAQPESISGICGTVGMEGGTLTFTGKAMYIPLLADGQLVPAAAPWVILRALRSGNMLSAGTEDGRIRLSIDDSYDEDALRTDILLDESDIPLSGQILYKGKRILSVHVSNFEIR